MNRIEEQSDDQSFILTFLLVLPTANKLRHCIFSIFVEVMYH